MSPADHTHSDEALIRRIAAGDRSATRVLFGRHQLRLYRFILRLVRDEALAEDLVSEAFLEAWRSANRFDGRSAVATWLLAIARHRAVDALRKRRDVALDEAAAATIADPAAGPEAALARLDRRRLVRSCLQQLSGDHAQIIDLVYYHEKSVSDVAQILGIPQATVKTRMFHVRKKLAGLLQGTSVAGAAA
jgi:RNA polymerase sigma-70 factor, ECF subfamily